MKGTIDSIEKKKTQEKNLPYHLITIDDERYSCWKPDLVKGISQGQQVEFEWEQSGDFKNITSMKAIAGSSPPKQTSRYDDTKVWNTCLMCAKDLVVAMIKEKPTMTNDKDKIKDLVINYSSAFHQASEGNQEPSPPPKNEFPSQTETFEDLKKMAEETNWAEEADVDLWLIENQEAIQGCTTGQQRILIALTDKEKNKLKK